LAYRAGIEIPAIFIGLKASKFIAKIKTGDLTLKSPISPFDRTLEGYLEPSL